jgi:uncharacterized protein (TIGR04255 family)
MFDKLPEPDGRPFPPGLAPVQLVTFELDFEQERPLQSNDGVMWQRLLEKRGLKPRKLASAKQQSLRVNLGTITSQRVVTEREGWVVAFPDDGASNSGLYATGVNLERHQYPGFEAYRQECLNVIDAAVELLAPRVQTRVALTYSNALSDKDAVDRTFWRDKVRSAFLGPVAYDDLVAEYTTGASAFTFESDGYVADLRVTLQPDQVFEGRHAVVFQSEARMAEVKELERGDLAQTLETLHTILLKMLYAFVEPKYVKHLRSAHAG